jgi:hypothetical protein
MRLRSAGPGIAVNMPDFDTPPSLPARGGAGFNGS